jgi:hypothetical protein
VPDHLAWLACLISALAGRNGMQPLDCSRATANDY